MALQAGSAAALVPVKGRHVMEAPTLLAKALALPLSNDAADLLHKARIKFYNSNVRLLLSGPIRRLA